MTFILQTLPRIHAAIFGMLDRAADAFALGLAARLVFAAVIFGYYLNSAMTKTGEGFAGFFSIQPSAFYQIAPQAVEAASGDIGAIAFLPWGLMVTAGTYAEYLLPVLIVAGLFTRLASLGMIGFIAVQTIVDIAIHKVDAATIGALFDRFPDSVIADQRLLWVFLLLTLVLKGPGLVSLDGMLARSARRVGRATATH